MLLCEPAEYKTAASEYCDSGNSEFRRKREGLNLLYQLVCYGRRVKFGLNFIKKEKNINRDLKNIIFSK